MKTNKQTVVTDVSDVAARQTYAGFAMTVTGRDADGRSCTVDVDFDWTWFLEVARSLGDVLAERDKNTQALRMAATEALG